MDSAVIDVINEPSDMKKTFSTSRVAGIDNNAIVDKNVHAIILASLAQCEHADPHKIRIYLVTYSTLEHQFMRLEKGSECVLRKLLEINFCGLILDDGHRHRNPKKMESKVLRHFSERPRCA